jgi:hypothetical protein
MGACEDMRGEFGVLSEAARWLMTAPVAQTVVSERFTRCALPFKTFGSSAEEDHMARA